MQLEFVVDGVTQMSRSMSRFADSLKDFTPVFEQISENFKAIEREQFNTEGGRVSNWTPLSEDYAEWKSLHFPGKPILQASGALMASLTGGTNFIKRITSSEMTIGSSDPKAIFHQRGTQKMPKREVIKLVEDDKRTWMKILQKAAVEAARREKLA